MMTRLCASALVLFAAKSVFAATYGSCLKVDLNDAVFAAARENTINVAEAAQFAFDGDIHTKWLDYSGGEPTWVTVDIQSQQPVTTYALVSANDAKSRDPETWTFSASKDLGDTWTLLDSQTGAHFSNRQERFAFQVNEDAVSYQLYRLNVTSLAGGESETLMQIAELELWYGDGCHDPCCGVDCGSHGSCNGETGICSCDDHYSGDSCETADPQWNEFQSRILLNDQLLWYKTTTLTECQTRCTMDWTGSKTPCIGVSFREDDQYCFLFQDPGSNGPTLEGDSGYNSYILFYAE